MKVARFFGLNEQMSTPVDGSMDTTGDWESEFSVLSSYGRVGHLPALISVHQRFLCSVFSVLSVAECRFFGWLAYFAVSKP